MEMCLYSAKVQLSVKAPRVFPQNLLDKLISKEHNQESFTRIFEILMTSDNLKEKMTAEQRQYLKAVWILSAIPTDNNEYHYDPVETNLQDTQRISMYHTYIDTPLNLNFETFQEAIKNNNYVEKECCINTLYDYYGDGLLNPNKKQKSYLITREMILETLGKTEDNVKDGIKLTELKMFFEKYKIQLRVINEFNKVIYTYDPEVRNRHHRAMYCMVKGNHIYTLNCDIKSLEQNQNYEPEVVVKASTECLTYEDAEPKQCRMISSVNDILSLVKELGDCDDANINLIHQNDDLVEICLMSLQMLVIYHKFLMNVVD
jgi:hypothetical protein